VIDFRYHVVSLVSVFLALAVGIVLGAGPLRENLGAQLQKQVSDLSKEKDGLRVDNLTKDASIEHRDDFITAFTPDLVTGELTGRGVAIVRLPGVEDATVDSVIDTLGTAGGTVTARVELTEAWTDPERRLLRDQVSDQLNAAVAGGVAGDDPQAKLDALLGRALVSGAPAGVEPMDDAARAILSGLDGGDLVNIEGEVENRGDVALVLVPGVATDQNDPQPTPAAGDDPDGDFVTLVRALDSYGGTVVSGPASSATNDGLVAAVRGDEAAAREVSTVDSGQTPMGDVAAALALREQADGRAGQYGFGDGATAPAPNAAAAS
jgi:Holliday junction resolvase